MAPITDAVDVVVALARKHATAASLRLFKPRFPGLVQDRMNLTAAELALVDQAVAWRDSTRVPFWDSLLLHAEMAPVVSESLLDAVQFHNSQKATAFSVPVNEGLGDRVRGEWETLAEDEALVVSSAVTFWDGSRRHIPMLDFHCVATPLTEQLVRRVAPRIWPAGGYLVASGKSFHFYGEGLLDDAGLVQFLAKALLYAPLVDRAWVAHQLLESACGLRVSPRHGYTSQPMVIDYISPQP